MPKLLQIGIYRRIIIVGFVVIIMMGFNFVVNRPVTELFAGLNFLFWFVGLPNEYGRKALFLPDYIFIAPFSFEQRKKAVGTVIRRDIMSTYLSFICIGVLPILIYSMINKNIFLTLLCITECIIAFSLIYYSVCYIFLTQKEMGTIFVQIIYFVIITLMSGLEDFTEGATKLSEVWKNASGKTLDIIVMILINIISIIIALSYHVKYNELLLLYYADYELSREINKR